MARPRTPLLSRDRIVEAALALVDESGDFSFPRLARRLGVSQSSLYGHVEGREHLIELLRGRAVGELLRVPDASGPWREAVAAMVRAYWTSMRAHPRLAPLLLAQPIEDADVLAVYEGLARVLDAAGFDDATIDAAILSIDHLVIGLTMDTAGGIVAFRADEAAPTLARASRSHASLDERAEATIAFGLEAVVGALERIEAGRPRGGSGADAGGADADPATNTDQHATPACRPAS